MTKGLIMFNDIKSAAAEAYRMLRTNIDRTGVDKKHRMVLITSSKKTEGKSTTAANLAIAYAQSGNKTLLIDCDLRRPNVHKLFNVDNLSGLSDILLDDMPVNAAIHQTATNENLSLLTSGKIPPMPAELLDSFKMERLLIDLRNKYDYIIVDTPPVLSVADATILAKFVDGCILAVAAQETAIDAVVTAKKALDKVNANVIGTVLTKAKITKKGYYYYEYDYK